MSCGNHVQPLWELEEMKNIDLTPLEQGILQRSSDLAVTRRRRTTVVIAGVVAAATTSVVVWLLQSWRLMLVFFLVYVAVTVFEKVAYANAVLAYKSLIQKLKKRVEELESVASNA